MYNRRTHIRYERLASATTVNNYRNKRTSLLTYHIIKAITRSSIGPSLDLHNQQTKCCTEINNQTAIDSSALDSLLHLSNGRPLRASKTSLTYTVGIIKSLPTSDCTREGSSSNGFTLHC